MSATLGQFARCAAHGRVRILSRKSRPKFALVSARYAATGAFKEPRHPSLDSLRRAIATSNVEVATENIKFFLTPRNADALGNRELHDITAFLHKNPHTRDELGLDALVLLASRGQSVFINLAMRSAIRDGRHSDVIHVWKMIHKELSSTKSHLLNLKQLKRSMACAVLALALQSAQFHTFIPLFLRLPVELDLTPDELDTLAIQSSNVTPLPSTSSSSSPVHAQSVEYLETIRKARLLEHPQTTLNWLQQQFNAGEIQDVLKLADTIMAGISSSPPWIQAGNPQQDDINLLSVPEKVWSAIMSGLIKAGRGDAAKSMWDGMTKFKVPQTVISWNALLDGYGSRGTSQQVTNIWKTMNERGIHQDVMSYTTVISALFQAKEADQALEMFQELRNSDLVSASPSISSDRQHFAENGADPPTILIPTSHLISATSLTPAYNAVLHGLLISARVREADQLFRDMQENGPKPDVTTLNTFIRHYDRKGDMPNLAALLRQLPKLNIQPDVFTFTTVLHACLRAGVPINEAITTVETAMQATGVKPNIVTYSAIVDQTVRRGGIRSIEAAVAWLDAIERRGLAPNEVTFTSILSALQRDRSLSPHFVQQQTAAIIIRMQANGSKINRVTFNVLIKATLAGDPGIEGLAKGVGMLDEMKTQGVRATSDTWWMLLQGAVQRKAWDLGAKVLDEMRADGFNPQARIAQLARRIQARA